MVEHFEMLKYLFIDSAFSISCHVVFSTGLSPSWTPLYHAVISCKPCPILSGFIIHLTIKFINTQVSLFHTENTEFSPAELVIHLISLQFGPSCNYARIHFFRIPRLGILRCRHADLRCCPIFAHRRETGPIRTLGGSFRSPVIRGPPPHRKNVRRGEQDSPSGGHFLIPTVFSFAANVPGHSPAAGSDCESALARTAPAVGRISVPWKGCPDFSVPPGLDWW